MSQTATQSEHPRDSAALAPRQGAGEPMDALLAFLRELLREQCRQVGAVGAVAFLRPSGGRPGGPVATYLEQSAAGALSSALSRQGPTLTRLGRLAAEAAEGARSEAITITEEGLYASEPTHRALMTPLAANGTVEGACVALVPMRAGLEDAEAMVRLTLLAARFETFLWRQQCLTEAEHKAKLREALELLDAAQQGASAAAMGSLMCHELARRFGCTRVSIGLIRRGALRLAGVSGAEAIDRRSPAVEAIEAAMEECADQDVEVVFPQPPDAPPSERRAVRMHQTLHEKFGPAAIVSLPLRIEGDLVGVALLERPADDPFPPGALPLLRLIGEFIGPALWTRRLADRGVLAVSRDRLVDLGAAVVGPRHTGKKLLGAVAGLALAAMALIPIPDRVVAPVEIQPAQMRTITPPFTGLLAQVMVEPGDAVAAGDVIARMDTADIEADLAGQLAERQSLIRQRDDALAGGRVSEAEQIQGAIDEKDARIAQLELHIERSLIKAPVDGVISGSDLDPFVNARVDPLTSLVDVIGAERIAVLRVDERDIRDVIIGQGGRLTVKSMPGERAEIRVRRINPRAEAGQGANTYTVEADFVADPGWVRSGMTGTAKLQRGVTTGLARIIGPLIDEARMKLWW
ncbi:MAG: HlyD family efflux transporter periplasmic adaptor subunit [Phycisphaerales bacterium JB039]